MSAVGVRVRKSCTQIILTRMVYSTAVLEVVVSNLSLPCYSASLGTKDSSTSSPVPARAHSTRSIILSDVPISQRVDNSIPEGRNNALPNSNLTSLLVLFLTKKHRVPH